MTISPTLLLHIASGTVGLFSGAAAIVLLKSSRRHALAGKVFVIAMLSLAATGTYMGLIKSQPGNVLGGTLTFYLVSTAWITAKSADSSTGFFDWAALAVVFTLAVIEINYGLQALASPTGMKYDYPPGPYFFLGSVAILAAIGDIRMIARGGISGAQRIARHLWRMCFALFVASGSVFLARARLFPVIMQKTGMLILLTVLPLILMIYWLIRVLATKYAMRTSIARMQPTSERRTALPIKAVG